MRSLDSDTNWQPAKPRDSGFWSRLAVGSGAVAIGGIVAGIQFLPLPVLAICCFVLAALAAVVFAISMRLM